MHLLMHSRDAGEKIREAAAVLNICCPSRRPRIEVGIEKFTRNHR